MNGVGLIFCVVQLFFYIIFPRKKATMTAVSQRADKEVVGEVEQGGGRGDKVEDER